MKKLLALTLAILFVLCITACSSSASDVTITLPSGFVGDETDDLVAFASENDYKQAEINEDGSMTITMSKKRHGLLLKETRQLIEDSFAEIIASEDTPYVTDITASENFGEITIKVDKEGYQNAFLDFTPLGVSIMGSLYQTVLGDQIHISVTVADLENGEVLAHQEYPDDFGN